MSAHVGLSAFGTGSQNLGEHRAKRRKRVSFALPAERVTAEKFDLYAKRCQKGKRPNNVQLVTQVSSGSDAEWIGKHIDELLSNIEQ